MTGFMKVNSFLYYWGLSPKQNKTPCKGIECIGHRAHLLYETVTPATLALSQLIAKKMSDRK